MRYHKLGMAMLTGIGSIKRIGEVHSELSPKQRLASVEPWSEKSKLLMVGDGINDALALAAATGGVACGFSDATALYAADVVLVKSNLMGLPHRIG